MAADDQLKILAFCWNTESLFFSRTPDGEEVAFTQEDLNEMQKLEEPKEQNPYQSWYGYAADTTGSFFSSTASLLGGITSYAAWETFKYLHQDQLSADFIDPIKIKIVEENPDIICITLIESAKPGDYLISHIFPEIFKDGTGGIPTYTLQYRQRFIGTGVSTVKSAVMRGIRVGIFIRDDHLISDSQIAGKIPLEHQNLFKYNSHACDSQNGKGGLGIFLNHPRFGNIGFVGMHLPHNAGSLVDYRNPSSKKYLNKTYRQHHVNNINKCFNGVVENVVFNENDPLDVVLIMGDFNYRIQSPSALNFTQYMMSPNFDPQFVYQNYDEYHLQTSFSTIHEFIEGVDGRGPTFKPTCKMIKDRDLVYCDRQMELPDDWNYNRTPSQSKYSSSMKSHERALYDRSDLAPEKCWNLGKYDQRTPSWCDRIVYQTFIVDGGLKLDITCNFYDSYRYDGNMTKSDHDGVWGIFTITKH